jgi:hypothetical protein
MKKIQYIMMLAALLSAAGCDDYDDTRVKQEVSDIEATVSELEAQLNQLNSSIEALKQLSASSFITHISKDADGNYVVSYQTGTGDAKTLVLTTQTGSASLPIISAAKDDADGVWYWRTTTDNGKTYSWLLADGQRIPVSTATPTIAIDSDGYWTINGARVNGSDGKPLLASDVSNSIFSSATVDETSNRAIFTLADGTVLELVYNEVLGITFDAAPITAIPDRTKAVKIKYEVYGAQKDQAVVDCFTAYGVTVNVERDLNTISVRLDDGAESGNLVMMVHANGTTVLKPLFFTYGTAEIDTPVLDSNGINGEVILPGEMTTFDIKVSHDIDYEVTISPDAASWIIPATTKAKVETTHSFTADYYSNDLGLVRQGVITFANRYYNVSVDVTVKQSPVAVEGKGGISNSTDLLAFANAVNLGASTARWQDESGAVVLTQDIDMTGVTTWTPIGNVTEGYTAVNPFTGVFDGKGYAIKNFNPTFTVGEGSNLAYGFFGALKGATVRNLILGSDNTDNVFTVKGTAKNNTIIGAVTGYSENSTIESVTNYVTVAYEGEIPSGVMVCLSGIAGVQNGGLIGGDKRALATANYGDVYTGKVQNEANGATSIQVAGIVGYMQKANPSVINYCSNYGNISCPTGRGGGLVGTADAGSRISNSDNYGTVEDDKVGQYAGQAADVTYNVKRQGGLAGALGNNSVILEYCTNYGDVYSHLGCRTGGFVGHSTGAITGCVNKGNILSDYTVSGHGAGWACGYSQASSTTYTNVKSCSKGGHVGSYTEYKDDPSKAPEATDNNAFAYKPETYDPTINN